MDIGEDNQFAFFPIKYPQLYKYYDLQQRLFWTAKDVNYKNDRDQFDKQDPEIQSYVKFLLFLFAQLDGIVNVNLVDNFKKETSEWKECSMFYAIQEAIEWVHNEVYSNLIKAIVRDEQEQLKGLNSIKYYPSITKIADWCFKWMDPKLPLTQRIVAFACIEGIIFSSAFAGIYWIKRKNILHGLTQANEWIARDEALHTEFAVALYHFLTGIVKKFPLLTDEKIKEIISSAVEITEMFTRDAMPQDFIGLNANDLIDYVKCTGDRLSSSLGSKNIYDRHNPLDWMSIIGLPNKTNFFESKVSEYARPEKSDFELKFDEEDF